MRIVQEHRGKGMFSAGSRYQATANEAVTVDNIVTAKYKLQSRAASKSPINPVTNPNEIYNYSNT
jgi:hypothetical protein